MSGGKRGANQIFSFGALQRDVDCHGKLAVDASVQFAQIAFSTHVPAEYKMRSLLAHLPKTSDENTCKLCWRASVFFFVFFFSFLLFFFFFCRLSFYAPAAARVQQLALHLGLSARATRFVNSLSSSPPPSSDNVNDTEAHAHPATTTNVALVLDNFGEHTNKAKAATHDRRRDTLDKKRLAEVAHAIDVLCTAAHVGAPECARARAALERHASALLERDTLDDTRRTVARAFGGALHTAAAAAAEAAAAGNYDAQQAAQAQAAQQQEAISKLAKLAEQYEQKAIVQITAKLRALVMPPAAAAAADGESIAALVVALAVLRGGGDKYLESDDEDGSQQYQGNVDHFVNRRQQLLQSASSAGGELGSLFPPAAAAVLSSEEEPSREQSTNVNAQEQRSLIVTLNEAQDAEADFLLARLAFDANEKLAVFSTGTVFFFINSIDNSLNLIPF